MGKGTWDDAAHAKVSSLFLYWAASVRHFARDKARYSNSLQLLLAILQEVKLSSAQYDTIALCMGNGKFSEDLFP